MYVCMYVCMHVRMCVYVSLSVCIYVHVFVCILFSCMCNELVIVMLHKLPQNNNNSHFVSPHLLLFTIS